MAMCVSLKLAGFNYSSLGQLTQTHQRYLGVLGLTHEVETRTASKVFHDNPKLVSAKERAFILGYKRTGTRAKNGYFRLNILDVIVVGFEIDLYSKRALLVGANLHELFIRRVLAGLGQIGSRTCLIATVSPVAFSMPL